MAARSEPDLVLLDQQLPDLPGTEVCRQLRSDPRFGPSLPIIITTAGPSGRPQRMTAYEAGAWEFYGQPLDSDALLHKMSVYIAAYAEARRLRSSAMFDDVTGFYNECGWKRRATEVIAEARRSGHGVACVGWSVGREAAAREAADACRSSVRAADVIGRLDSGMFAIVAGGTGILGADRLASRFRHLIAGAVGAGPDEIRTTIVAGDDPAEFPADGDQLFRQLEMSFAA